MKYSQCFVDDLQVSQYAEFAGIILTVRRSRDCCNESNVDR